MPDALRALGWKGFFQQQVVGEPGTPVRIVAVHRDRLVAAGAEGNLEIPVRGSFFDAPPESLPTVGDWLLVDMETSQPLQTLERSSLFLRMAAGGDKAQLLAANVDTVFIVSSCNHDFNLSRIERYQALVQQAGARSVVVLTRADTCADADNFRERALSTTADCVVETVNALDPDDVSVLKCWLGPGETIALLGSSGVGKSTLLNSLMQTEVAQTAGIREDDSKGRHTTTHRELHHLPGGAMLLDTPGMRELSLAGAEAGIDAAFAEIAERASGCRFKDCQHRREPGCAVRKAVAEGVISERRLENWRKLQRESARNQQTLAEKRSGDRSLAKTYRAVQQHARGRKTDGNTD
ncbi:ribosome small subunit-dependent GTPase A [Biformimicrobium ophioploci]|uniref:Small ribosomal subunit biogenesis GTPase RsgA n=1 Tax=Biformimicrobium ophioploci TaxID=3036711 RepID=A0ABQ6LVC9_9GAMM|nr:ribosome small subunit-dependent GTPase A [Microbulbifer sp. NKW57]GMG86035.1 ribosome small subunit-dependent GTPase A [Microbulbifer sp. NKW57]